MTVGFNGINANNPAYLYQMQQQQRFNPSFGNSLFSPQGLMNFNPWYNPYWNVDNVQQPYGPNQPFGPQPVPQPKPAEPKKKKMGFFEGIGHAIKGAAKAVVNTVKGILTDPKKLLLTAGAIALAVVCPPAGVAMAVAGGISGAVKVGKGVKDVMTAQTYEEQVMAAENIGAGALQVGLSYFGAKASLGKMGINGSMAKAATWKAYGSATKTSLGNMKAGVGNFHNTVKMHGGYRATASQINQAVKANGGWCKVTGRSMKNLHGTIKTNGGYWQLTKDGIKAARNNPDYVLPPSAFVLVAPNNPQEYYQNMYAAQQYNFDIPQYQQQYQY